MGKELLRNVRRRLYRKGRHLDVTLWNYHFENGSDKEVLKALATYQNSDGGFGHGLEPDLTTQVSNPMATSVAFRILRQIKIPVLAQGLIKEAGDYLLNLSGDKEGAWPSVGKESLQAPHAQHWEFMTEASLNPSAELNSFLYRYGTVRQKEKVQDSVATIKEMLLYLKDMDSFHTLASLVLFYQDLKDTALFSPDEKTKLEEKLTTLVKQALPATVKDYEKGEYLAKPTFFIFAKDSFLRKGLEDYLQDYARYLENSLNKTGDWNLTWDWGAYSMPATVREDWKGQLTVENMLYLQYLAPNDPYLDRIERF